MLLGSGPFYRNDPNTVADIVAKILHKYRKYFLCILFCIRKADDYHYTFEKFFGSKNQRKIYNKESCSYKAECDRFYDSQHRSDLDHPNDCPELGLCRYLTDKVE